MLSVLTLYVPIFLFILYAVRRFFRPGTLGEIRGPQSSSHLFGNLLQIRDQKNVGDFDFKCIRQYGGAWRVKGLCGTDILMLADPKGLQHILHTSGYRYPKNAVFQQTIRSFSGTGILWAHGDTHQRHRKVMNPAFSAQQLRSFLPLFRRSAKLLTEKWKTAVLTQASEAAVVLNVPKWFARTTLDVIGEAAFDYSFGALDDAKVPLAVAVDNLFVDSALYPSTWDILFKGLWRYIPVNILKYVKYIPTREYRRYDDFLELAKNAGRDFLREKAGAHAVERGARDVMSILVTANESEDAKRKLDEEEVVCQIATMILAGHETTASTLTWLFWELSKHPEDQEKVRQEIVRARAQVIARGDEDFTLGDMDSMTYTMAVIKENLRLHPIVYHIDRDADRDDVIPLSIPVEDESGQIISSIPVKKGQQVKISICAYQRLKEVWGDDADEWNPSRFLRITEDKQTAVGVFANLLSFSAGLRACIGWRFSIIEMQAVLVELIENFQFALPQDKPQIMRVPAFITIPMVEGQMDKGVQMPLSISLVSA